MWRSFFFAIGAMLVIVGVECLVIESATLMSDQQQTAQVSNGWFQTPQVAQVNARVVRPAEWIPWSLIASGTIVILYSMTLPRRWASP